MDIISLVEKAKKQDKEALTQLVLKEKDNYYRLAFSFMKNQHDSMDMVSEMILILYDNIKNLKDNEKFYSWSKTILVNLCKKALKDRNKIIDLDSVKDSSTSLDDTMEEEMDIDLYIDKLSKKHKEVIRLRYFLDMDYATISEVLKIPIGTVKSRINKGLSDLREMVRGDEYYG